MVSQQIDLVEIVDFTYRELGPLQLSDCKDEPIIKTLLNKQHSIWSAAARDYLHLSAQCEFQTSKLQTLNAGGLVDEVKRERAMLLPALAKQFVEAFRERAGAADPENWRTVRLVGWWMHSHVYTPKDAPDKIVLMVDCSVDFEPLPIMASP